MWVYFLCVDGAAGGTAVRLPRAQPVLAAQAHGAPQGPGVSEEHQRTGPSPAHCSCLASAVHQSCHSAAHSAEGAARGQNHIHSNTRKNCVCPKGEFQCT